MSAGKHWTYRHVRILYRYIVQTRRTNLDLPDLQIVQTYGLGHTMEICKDYAGHADLSSRGNVYRSIQLL